MSPRQQQTGKDARATGPKGMIYKKRSRHNSALPGFGWLAMIALVAVGARLIVLWQLSQNSPGFFLPSVDSRWHYEWARAIAGGDWLGSGVFYRAPLYPYLLGLWITLFGDGLWGIKIAQAVIGAVTAAFVAIPTARLFGQRAGITAGLIWALYGTVIYYETEMLIPVIALPLNILALDWAIRSSGQPARWKPWFVVGLILGVSAIARPNILLTVPAFWWWAWKSNPESEQAKGKRWTGALAVTIGLLIPILPVTIRNAVVGNDAVLISYQGGVNLYLGNNPQADGLTMMMPDLVLDESVGWRDFVRVTDSIAQVQSGQSLSPSGISSFWTGKALSYMGNHPLEALERILKKAYYLINGFEVSDQTDIYTYTNNSSLLKLLIYRGLIYLPFGILVPFAVLAVPSLWHDRVRGRPLLAFALLYSITVVLFLATARHRLPFAIVIVMMASAGLWLLIDAIRQSEWSRGGMLAAVVIVATLAVNRPTTDRIMWNPSLNHYQQGLIHDRRGEYYLAIEQYEQAVAIEPMNLEARKRLASSLIRVNEFDSAIATGFDYLRAKPEDSEIKVIMGKAYLGMGDTAKARASFRIAARDNPGDPHPYFELGALAFSKDDYTEALVRYNSAIEADSTFAPAYDALALIYTRSGNPDRGIEILRSSLRHVPKRSAAWANIGAILLESGKSDEAVNPLRTALQLNPGQPDIRFNLAVAFLRNGDGDASMTELRGILDDHPGFVKAESLLERLDSARRAITQ